jgi:hypothetical protein
MYVCIMNVCIHLFIFVLLDINPESSECYASAVGLIYIPSRLVGYLDQSWLSSHFLLLPVCVTCYVT